MLLLKVAFAATPPLSEMFTVVPPVAVSSNNTVSLATKSVVNALSDRTQLLVPGVTVQFAPGVPVQMS